MAEIKNIENEQFLRKAFNFLLELFYDEALEYGEYYYTMTEWFAEMKEQLNKNNKLLLYIEEANKIIAALTSKNLDSKEGKITLGVMGVSRHHRRKGYATKLIQEFEEICKNKGIKQISLGAKFRACPLYISLGYKPSLMVQVFDFATIEDIKKQNKYDLVNKQEMHSDGYGFVFFEVEKVEERYIKYFEDNVKTSQAQYVFEKEL